MPNFDDGVEMQNFYLRMKNELEEAGILSASFELRQILEHFTGDKFYEVRLENEFDEPTIDAMEEIVRRRVAGEPLQYLLGGWDFMGLPFSCGEGVLIPRPETELLVEKALDSLGGAPARVLDLCCGSGCIGISIQKLAENTLVTCVDLYDAPIEFTNKNAEKNGVADRLTVIRADVTAKPELTEKFDMIVSNPPYISSRELDFLQREVQREPREALDGGKDGLDFYRAIAENWLCLLNEGGKVFFEVGIYQAEEVKTLLENAGLIEVKIHEDYAGIGRIVEGLHIG